MTPRRRTADGVVALLALGVWLLMPPVISLFVGPERLLGVPVLVVYLFGVWLAFILATMMLSRRLPRTRDDAPGRLPPLAERPGERAGERAGEGAGDRPAERPEAHG